MSKKNYGLVIAEQDPRAYVLGAGRLPEVVLLESGNWDDYLPVYEAQALNYETYGCTAYGSLNLVEMMVKRLTNFEENYSDRFVYNVAEINQPGDDPHRILEIIRNDGVVYEKDLPRPETLKEFKTPRPMTPELREKAKKFPWEVKHEYVKWNDLENKKYVIKNALRYSPLGVSVTAWNLKNGIYVDNGQPNNHWCVLYGWNAKGWKIFDTYDGGLKTLAWDHNFQVCKRIHLEKNNFLPKKWTIIELIKKLALWIGLIESGNIPQEDTKTSQETPILPVLEPTGSRILELASAIKEFEGFYKPGDNVRYPNGTVSWRNNNPGNIKGRDGKFLKFKTFNDGWEYLVDYLNRACTGKHKSYRPDMTLLEFCKVYAPSNDGNHPKNYALFISKRLGITLETKINSLV